MKNLRQGMVSIYMAYVLKKEELPVKGSADRYRDFIYIDDVINSYMDCIDKPVSFGKAYNVASGVKTTVKELLESMLKTFGHSPSESYPVKYYGSTPGDTFGIYADISAIKRDIGWEPSVNLGEGIRRMKEWAESLNGDQK
jgi:UDP-glucose 4-epimerase